MLLVFCFPRSTFAGKEIINESFESELQLKLDRQVYNFFMCFPHLSIVQELACYFYISKILLFNIMAPSSLYFPLFCNYKFILINIIIAKLCCSFAGYHKHTQDSLHFFFLDIKTVCLESLKKII